MTYEWMILLKYLDNKLIFLWEEQQCLKKIIGYEKFSNYMNFQNKKRFGD